MRRTLAVLAICSFLFLGSRVAQAQTWHQGRTGAFSVTTDAGDGTTRDFLNRFEQERVIIAQILHKQKLVPPGVIQIIAVRDPQSLSKSVPQFPAELLSRGAITFDGMERSNLIFVTPQQSESAARAVASVLLAANYPHTPRWFDHGFARYANP